MEFFSNHQLRYRNGENRIAARVHTYHRKSLATNQILDLFHSPAAFFLLSFDKCLDRLLDQRSAIMPIRRVRQSIDNRR